MRTYERTNPWLKFQMDMRPAGPEIWLDLGEIASKCEHLSFLPLRPETAKQLHQVYLAKGVAATTAIEGNTLSEADVRKAVEGKLTVPPSKEYLKQEVDNIIAACNGIGKAIVSVDPPQISLEMISSFNRQVLQNLPLDEGVVPGELRGHQVVVGNVYRAPVATDCGYLLERLCDWLQSEDFKATKGRETVHAVIKAIVAHLYLVWIHPFGDGNGRTARLLEFQILLAAGIPSPAAHLLSNHYNQTRSEYYRQLDLASKTGGDIIPFLHYAVRGFVDGLHEQMNFVWEQQWDMVWQNHVHEQFHNRTNPSDIRERHLALDLGAKNDWVTVAEISELTPRLAKAYAGKTTKTVQRDINQLGKMSLITREGRKVRARREVIFSFLPLQRIPNKDRAEAQ
jgi:Fic family protein